MSQRYLPEKVENYRDDSWSRDPEVRIEDVNAAERLVDRVGFCSALTDSRRPGPSLFIAVCGRRDAHTPRNVQKDPEIARAYLLAAGMTWRGELASVTGLSNSEAGIGNWALVDEGFAVRVAPGVYRLRELEI